MPRPPHPRLRAWTEVEFPAWEALHQDAEVARWLGGAMPAEARRAAFDRTALHLAAQGWGVWAILDEHNKVVGAAGLQTVRPGMPFVGVEAAWRLRADAWGRGYVSMVMPALLEDGFDRLPLVEIVTCTARSNVRSQAVMQRLGFRRDEARDFDHPALAEDHPLRPHVMYSMPKPQES